MVRLLVLPSAAGLIQGSARAEPCDRCKASYQERDSPEVFDGGSEFFWLHSHGNFGGDRGETSERSEVPEVRIAVMNVERDCQPRRNGDTYQRDREQEIVAGIQWWPDREPELIHRRHSLVGQSCI